MPVKRNGPAFSSMQVLTVNTGSNSLKFEVIQTDPGTDSFGRSLLSGSYDNIGKDDSMFALLDGKQPHSQEKVEVRDHGHAAELLLDWIDHGGARDQGISDLGSLDRIGHRIVHGADLFDGPARITSDVIQKIESLQDLAPLHNASALKAIRAAEAKLGSRVPMFGVFDTVFHRTIPDYAALYPIPTELANRHKIRRYGFHGLSHRYMMMRYAEIANRSASSLNLITMHLEGGSSVAAIQAGQSIDTSMGFTPLEGLMMGTRSGDIDPAIVTYLMRKENLEAAGVEKFLNKECGLLGVSGLSADTRILREHLGEPSIDLAVNMFCYRVRKYIGAYLAALGGADAIVMGGGIGENTAFMRERICASMGWCGATLDPERNRNADDRETTITTRESSLQIWVIPTQEGLMMAREIAEVA